MINVMRDAKLYSAWVNIKRLYPKQIHSTFAEFNAFANSRLVEDTDCKLVITAPKRLMEINITRYHGSCSVRCSSRSFLLDELNYNISLYPSNRVPPAELYKFSSSETIKLSPKGIFLTTDEVATDLIVVRWPMPIRAWLNDIELIQKPSEIIYIMSKFGGDARLYIMVGETKIYGIIKPPKEDNDEEPIDTNY